MIGTKLTYALEALSLKQSGYTTLDACCLKGLGQIRGMTTTFGQHQAGEEMANANQAVVAAVNRVFKNYLFCKGKDQRKVNFELISERIKIRAKEKLGSTIRKNPTDPMFQVLLGLNPTSEEPRNLPTPPGLNPWRPKVNWIIETASQAWIDHKLHLRLRQPFYTNTHPNKPPKGKEVGEAKIFNYKAITHVRALIEAARRKIF